MNALTHARHIVDSMLGYLGFAVRIEETDGPEGPTLQLHTEDAERLIGRRGATWPARSSCSRPSRRAITPGLIVRPRQSLAIRKHPHRFASGQA